MAFIYFCKFCKEEFYWDYEDEKTPELHFCPYCGHKRLKKTSKEDY